MARRALAGDRGVMAGEPRGATAGDWWGLRELMRGELVKRGRWLGGWRRRWCVTDAVTEAVTDTDRRRARRRFRGRHSARLWRAGAASAGEPRPGMSKSGRLDARWAGRIRVLQATRSRGSAGG